LGRPLFRPGLQASVEVVEGGRATPEPLGTAGVLGWNLLRAPRRARWRPMRSVSERRTCKVWAAGYDVPAVTAPPGGNPASRAPTPPFTAPGATSAKRKASKRKAAPKPPTIPGTARIVAIANQKGGV